MTLEIQPLVQPLGALVLEVRMHRWVALLVGINFWAMSMTSSAYAGVAKQTTHEPKAVVTAGNTIYNVHVEDASGPGLGLYTVTTGLDHPAGAGLSVLFGNGSPGTTFNTIRSYTSNTDYVQLGTLSGNPTVLLELFGTVTPIGTTGFRTTYVLPGPPTTPDALTIISDVNVNGTTFTDSTVEVTTTVTNNSSIPVDIGIRYLWDLQIGADDGPTFQEINPDGAVRITEAEFLAPSFVEFSIEDNDINLDPPTFNVLGTVSGPVVLTPTPTTPSLLQYVCWGDAEGIAFDYTVDPLRDIATTAASDCRGAAGGDSAVLYFFGHDAASAIRIEPSEERTVSASLFLIGGEITLAPLAATNLVGENHTVIATVADIGGAPVGDREVTFNVLSGPNAGETGTDMTDASGEATFTYPGDGGPGIDVIQASFEDSQQNTLVSNAVTKEWIDPLFADGFESGDTSAWSVTVP